jgi:hypothetical protein
MAFISQSLITEDCTTQPNTSDYPARVSGHKKEDVRLLALQWARPATNKTPRSYYVIHLLLQFKFCGCGRQGYITPRGSAYYIHGNLTE